MKKTRKNENMGRPCFEKHLKRYRVVRFNDFEEQQLKQLGYANLVEGVRAAIDHFIKTKGGNKDVSNK